MKILLIINPTAGTTKGKNAILTPHIVEFSRLSGVEVSEIKENPEKILNDFCKEYGVTVILKDSVTVTIRLKSGVEAVIDVTAQAAQVANNGTSALDAAGWPEG